MDPNPLPIDPLLPHLRSAFGHHRSIVLSAEPGAGKTTRVPLALIEDSWLGGQKIIMLEPRRLAARRSAEYMAKLIGERVGETLGYRIRGDSKIGQGTRIEVVTEGILTRVLQDDPSLPGVGLVIFDEFHERSVHADLGLALVLDTQEHLRNDLRILVMSATLDVNAISSLLGDAPIIRSEGRLFPVETRFLQSPADGPVESMVASAIRKVLRDEPDGHVLVFLPGQREIRRVEALLSNGKLPSDVSLHLLYGEASPERQQAALDPTPDGYRKVILSTSLAETSLTIDGVRIVIDSGLARGPRFDPGRGMSGLVTTPVSISSADQRRGRAGRQQPGVCYRLWTEQRQRELPQSAPPEILVTDLAPLALDLAMWGTPEGQGLRFLDPPPPAHLAQARTLLRHLGALDRDSNLTSHGRAMSALPIHPRYAHMLLRAKELGLGSLACDLAALLEERDLLRGQSDTDIDLHSRWYALRKESRTRDRYTVERIRAQAARLRKLVGATDDTQPEDRLGILLALAYPERVARRRSTDGNRYIMVGGAGALLPRGSSLSRREYLAIGDVDGIGSEVKVFLAEPITESDIRDAFAEQIEVVDEIQWDEWQEAIIARRVTRLGAVELSETPLRPSDDQIRATMISAIRQLGLNALNWTKHAVSVRTRSEWLRTHRLVGGDWPDLSDEYLIGTLNEWLGPYIGDISKRSQLQRLDISKIIDGLFSYKQRQELDRLAPTHHTVPTGSRIPLDYSTDQPFLAVRLQEILGETSTPTIAGGRVKVVLHLLSPAHRPLAVTGDLPSFWQNVYPEVRKDMRGRYPKHYWPENPLEATPTRRIKPKAG